MPTIDIQLRGREEAPRLPALFEPTLRSGRREADAFLPAGWLQPRATFDLRPQQRDADAPAAATLPAAADDVLVLELADGSVLVTSAARLREALAHARPELLGPGGEVLLDELRQSLPDADRGLGDVLAGLVHRVFSFAAGQVGDGILDDAVDALGGKAAEVGVTWAGTRALMWAVEKRLDRAPGLYRWVGGRGTADDLRPVDLVGPADAPLARPEDRPLLVFVHGTASSTLGSFGELRQGERELWAALEARYPDGILAFEHRTLSESPIENAIALVKALPRGAVVDLVSHSRGGLVADLLCLGDFDALIDGYRHALPGTGDVDPGEAQRVKAELEDAHAAQREQLRELAALLRERQPVIRRYVRTASPAAGTKLASGNFDVFLSSVLTLIGAVPFFFGSPVYAAFKRVVLEIARHRTNPHLVPGIEAMLPDSPLARLLHDAPVRGAIGMAVIAGDIEGGPLLKRLGVLLTDFLLFDNDDNDLVVDTTAMLAGVAPKAAARVLFDRGAEVSHFRYFVNADTRRALRDWLVAPDPSKLEPFRALPTPAEYEAALAQAGAASRDAAAQDRPVVVVLPGVMGTHLALPGGDRVWFDPLDIAVGGLSKIAWGQAGVTPQELFAMFYGQLCEMLSKTHRVERFPYDWRQPLDVLADALATQLEALAKQTQQPIRLLAHSMGGLVVRACIHRHRALMDGLMARNGARLVMLGTPHQGAHSMVANLIGKGDTLRSLVRLDLKHDMQEVLDIVAGFRGALQLLPKPGFVDTFQGTDDGGDTLAWQDAATWVRLKQKVTDLWFGNGRAGTPGQDVLDAASWLWRQDGNATPALPAAYEPKSVYVFGVAPNTPCGLREQGGRLRLVGTARGDGTVTWDSGRIGGIGAFFYMPAAHGDLPATPEHFPALQELLASGSTQRLLTSPPSVRALGIARPVTYDAPPPSLEENETLQRALLGGAPARRMPARPRAQLEVQVRAMDLRVLGIPILAGQYEQDPIAGPQAVIDGDLLAGALTDRYNLGQYAGPLGTATVVLRGVDAAHGAAAEIGSGAVIAGLGPYDGSLSPSRLAEAARTAVLRYLLQVADVLGDDAREVPLATLLVGYNSAVNLTVASSVEALVRGVIEGNARFAEVTRRQIRVRRLEIVELYLDTAISAAYALDAARAKLEPLAAQHGTELVCRAELDQHPTVRRRLYDAGRQSYWPRLMITDAQTGTDAAAGDDRWRAKVSAADEQPERLPELIQAAGRSVLQIGEKLRFLYVGQRARAESVVQQRQPGLVESLVRQQIANPVWRADFGRMLFQLMVPHEFKDAARELDRVVLVVDGYTANLPWELMLADDPTRPLSQQGDDARLPLALKSAVVRQFATSNFRRQVRQSARPTALVIGNPSVAGFEAAFLDGQGRPLGPPPDLPRAAAEAETIAARLANFGFGVTREIGPERRATDVLASLYRQPWRIVHVSAHGVFQQRHVDGTQRSGIVLSDGLLVTAAEIGAMEIVPELVFLNCCHLARVDPAANRLAASVARELIEIGVRCVIVAGWAIDDAIAQAFGETFYQSLLLGQRPFGLAVFDARLAAWEAGRGQDITWGAFQAYGDPGWLADPRAGAAATGSGPAPRFVSVDEALDELLRRTAELLRRGERLPRREIRQRAADAEKMLATRAPAGWERRADLLAALGEHCLRLGDLERAHAVLLRAVQCRREISDVELHTLQDLALIESQLPEWRAEDGLDDLDAWATENERLIRQALARLDQVDALVRIGLPEGAAAGAQQHERAALRGGAWKRLASLQARRLLGAAGTGRRRVVADAARAMDDALAHSIACYREAEGDPAGTGFRLYQAVNRLQLDALTPFASKAGHATALKLATLCQGRAREIADGSDDPWDRVQPADALVALRLIDGTLGAPGAAGEACGRELLAVYRDALDDAGFTPRQIDQIALHLDILARLATAVAQVRPDDGRMARTAGRLAALLAEVQPERLRAPGTAAAPAPKRAPPGRKSTSARKPAAKKRKPRAA